MTDIWILAHARTWYFTPLTQTAKEWMAKRVTEDEWDGKRLVTDAIGGRYFANEAEGDGLVIEYGGV